MDAGCTVILTTHYVEEVEGVADRVAVFDAGKVKVCDRPETIRSTVSGLFRLSIRREAGGKAGGTTDLVAALRSMGLSDVKLEADETIFVHVKANERPLLSSIFDWALKNDLTVNISPITLEDAYVELVK